MSSTNRGRKRAPNDLYETPPWAVKRFLEAVAVHLPAGHWLEPSCSTGKIIRTVESMSWDDESIKWHSVELRKVKPPTKRHHHGDFLKWKTKQRFAVILGNPPYSLAMEFVQKSLTLLDPRVNGACVALLLRLGFLESSKRCAWLRENTPSIYVLPNRPSFRWKGNDSATYAWLVWRRWDGNSERLLPTVTILDKTPKAERLADRKRT